MIYKVMAAAAAGLFLLAGCDDPKPTATEGRDVGAPSEMSGASSQQGTVAKETPGNTMMMQSGGNSGTAQTMQQGTAMENQPRTGPDGEPLAGVQPLKPAQPDSATNPAPNP